jgi:hypothetical protein
MRCKTRYELTKLPTRHQQRPRKAVANPLFGLPFRSAQYRDLMLGPVPVIPVEQYMTELVRQRKAFPSFRRSPTKHNAESGPLRNEHSLLANGFDLSLVDLNPLARRQPINVDRYARNIVEELRTLNLRSSFNCAGKARRSELLDKVALGLCGSPLYPHSPT